MVKIAITVMLFALLAVCFAARIPREVASPPKEGDVQQGITDFFAQLNKIIQDNKFQETLKKTFSDENLKVFKDAAEHLSEESKKLVTDVSGSLQKLGEKQ